MAVPTSGSAAQRDRARPSATRNDEVGRFHGEQKHPGQACQNRVSGCTRGRSTSQWFHGSGASNDWKASRRAPAIPALPSSGRSSLLHAATETIGSHPMHAMTGQVCGRWGRDSGSSRHRRGQPVDASPISAQSGSPSRQRRPATLQPRPPRRTRGWRAADKQRRDARRPRKASAQGFGQSPTRKRAPHLLLGCPHAPHVPGNHVASLARGHSDVQRNSDSPKSARWARRSLNETSASLLASQARRESGLLTQPFAKLAK